MRIILITLILTVNLSHPLFAKIASVIGDPISQEIYFEVNKDTKNYPASLTKIMTLYILFDELRLKNINLKLKYPKRFFFKIEKFSNIKDILEQFDVKRINGVTLDLGLSSPQIDNSSRGFSFNTDGPLDMRMDNKRKEITAKEIINEQYDLDRNPTLSVSGLKSVVMDKNFLDAIKESDSTKKNFFIIDEAHNFINNLYNNIISKTGKRAFVIYDYILKEKIEAPDTMILLMSGTPAINNPFELALIFNLMRPGIFPSSELKFNEIYIKSNQLRTAGFIFALIGFSIVWVFKG